MRLQRLDELAMVVFRGTGTGTGTGTGYDEDGRPYGELGDEDPSAQQVADSRWWRVAKATRPRIKALVVVTAGTVTRIWQVQPSAPWTEQDGKVAIPLHGPPLDREAAARHFPELGMTIGSNRPMRRGLIREYLPLANPAENK